MKANKGEYLILALKRKRYHIKKGDKWAVPYVTRGLKRMRVWTKNNV
jgi:hypothetical protein